MENLICENVIKNYVNLVEDIGCTYFELEFDTNYLVKDYSSIFMSYEKDRDRLRIIAVNRIKEKEILFTAGKKTKNLSTIKTKAIIFCKLLQQIRNINSLIEEDMIIKELIQ